MTKKINKWKNKTKILPAPLKKKKEMKEIKRQKEKEKYKKG